MNNIFDVSVSLFENCFCNNPADQITLAEWLTTSEFKTQVDKIRNVEGDQKRKEAKKILPCITPSGVFSQRKASSLVRHSGFIAVDIDFAENKHLSNFDNLKEEFKKLPEVAYCGISVSGKGYWMLIRIAHPDKHKQHFNYLHKSFECYGIFIDKACSDVSRLRYYSYDTEAYWNLDAIPLRKYHVPQRRISRKYNSRSEKYQNYETYNPISTALKMIEEAQDGEKHSVLLNASRLLGGYVAGGEVDYEEAELALRNAIDNKRNVRDHKNAYKTIAKGLQYGQLTPISLSRNNQALQHNYPDRRRIKTYISHVENEDNVWKKEEVPIEKNSEAAIHEEEHSISILNKGVNQGQIIRSLKSFFKSCLIPNSPIRLESHLIILTPKQFIDNHLALIEQYRGLEICLPYLDRLHKLKEYLDNLD